MQFSLASMLICTAILAVVVAVCVAVPVHMPATQIVTKNRFDEARETTIAFDRQPTGAEVAMRLAWSAPLALAVVWLAAQFSFRRGSISSRYRVPASPGRKPGAADDRSEGLDSTIVDPVGGAGRRDGF
jgi:hypothetical protein